MDSASLGSLDFSYFCRILGKLLRNKFATGDQKFHPFRGSEYVRRISRLSGGYLGVWSTGPRTLCRLIEGTRREFFLFFPLLSWLFLHVLDLVSPVSTGNTSRSFLPCPDDCAPSLKSIFFLQHSHLKFSFLLISFLWRKKNFLSWKFPYPQSKTRRNSRPSSFFFCSVKNDELLWWKKNRLFVKYSRVIPKNYSIFYWI